MSNENLIMFLVGAIIIGFFIGFSYIKVKLSQKHEKDIKNLKEFLRSKDADIVALKKELRDIRSENKISKEQIEELEDRLAKKSKLYNTLKSSMLSIKQNSRKQKKLIKELESLVLEIQNDFEGISKELKEQKELNKRLQKEFEKRVERLTQKANDLFMVKGTEELKNAKAIFDKLREKSLNGL